MIEFIALDTYFEGLNEAINCPSGHYGQISAVVQGYNPAVLAKTSKYSGYVMHSAGGVIPLYIECAIQEDYPIEIDWDAPIYRQNGTPLRESEIYAYQVCYSNIDVDVTECEQFRGVNSATLTVYDAGDWVISIATISNDGLMSASNSYLVNIGG